MAHAEPAPFGAGTTTKLDPKVRAAHRLKARGKVVVHGFDPAAILDGSCPRRPRSTRSSSLRAAT